MANRIIPHNDQDSTIMNQSNKVWSWQTIGKQFPGPSSPTASVSFDGYLLMLLLLEQIRLTNWYGKYPIIYRVSYKSGGDRRISSSNSQQYHPKKRVENGST